MNVLPLAASLAWNAVCFMMQWYTKNCTFAITHNNRPGRFYALTGCMCQLPLLGKAICTRYIHSFTSGSEKRLETTRTWLIWPYQNQTEQPFSAFLSIDDITMRTLTFCFLWPTVMLYSTTQGLLGLRWKTSSALQRRSSKRYCGKVGKLREARTWDGGSITGQYTVR